MRHIVKLPIGVTIQNQLLAKQRRIDNAITPPNWNLDRVQKIEIKTKLLQAQKHLCCYCECEIDYNNHHIEHFYERHDQPDKIYDFENLILSCEGQKEPLRRPESSIDKDYRLDNIRCGHGKEKTRHQGLGVDYALLLNPVQDNEALFYYNDLGKVESNSTNPADTKKVIYTCERLNLNSDRLINERVDTIVLVERELAQLNLVEQKTYLEALLDNKQPKLPAFYSTIKDNFEFILAE